MTYDPWEAAGEQQTQKRVAQINFDLWACVWENKTVAPFDEQIHKISDRLTNVTMDFTTLTGKNFQFNHIAEWSDWQQTTLPSVMALDVPGATSPGEKLKKMNGQWVEYEIEEREYTKKGGGTGTALAVKFLTFLGDRAAAEAYTKTDSDDAPEAPPAGDNGKDRAVAAQFLGPLWAQAGKDPDKMADLLKSMPMVSQFFTIDSPEVQEVMS